MTLILGGCKISHFCTCPPEKLKVYIKPLTAFSHIAHPDGLRNTLLSQGCLFETVPSVGMVGGTYTTRAGEVERSI